MPRAIRKWLLRQPEGVPADLVVFLGHPVVARSRGQHVMALGCETVWKEILPELRRRGTNIIEAIHE
jgi:hypothetical protein